jgi:hypothetical protein
MANQSAPIVHSVYFYETEEALVLRLIGIVTSALNSGNAALMVVTREHGQHLTHSLSPRLFRTTHELARLTIVDAQATLNKFMVGGMPDRARFLQIVNTLVAEASIPAERTGGQLTIFGEMVALLWADGQKDAALALEGLWNEALSDGRFYLHCAYPKSQFTYDVDRSGIRSICELHSHTFGALDAAM